MQQKLKLSCAFILKFNHSFNFRKVLYKGNSYKNKEPPKFLKYKLENNKAIAFNVKLESCMFYNEGINKKSLQFIQ